MSKSQTTRRAVLGGITTAALSSSAAGAVTLGDHRRLDQLWSEYSTARQSEMIAVAAKRAALEQIPDWAKEGPAYIDNMGARTGAFSEAPEIKVMPKLPRYGEYRRIRFSPNDLLESAEDMLRTFGGAHPMWKNFRATYERRLAVIQERIVEADAEKEKVGLPALQAARDNAAELETQAETRLLEFIATQPPYIDAVAALVLYECDLGNDFAVDELLRYVVSGIRAPAIAQSAREAIAASDEERAETARDVAEDEAAYKPRPKLTIDMLDDAAANGMMPERDGDGRLSFVRDTRTGRVKVA